jgi:antirestriction protein ArdC
VLAEHVTKLRDILAQLAAAQTVTQIDLPGYRWHALKGFKQVNQLGGAVSKGEQRRNYRVWKIQDADQRDLDAVQSEGDESPRRRFTSRFYRAWNVEQLPCRKPCSTSCRQSRRTTTTPIEAAEKIIAGMPNRPEIRYGGSQAFYSPLSDRITLPSLSFFTSAEELSATKIHEICTVASVLVDGGRFRL